MGEKVLSSRIQNKCDTTANWTKATNFIPKSGEIIIYSDGGGAGKPKLKVGDGSTAVGSLKFCDADSASTLSTGRTIKIQGGSALNGTAVTFDGSKDIQVPLGTVQAGYLTWGGRNTIGDTDPISAALSSMHHANRAQFAHAAGITFEYSNDGGATWLDYEDSEQHKVGFVSGLSEIAIYAGKKTSGQATLDDQVRVTINAKQCGFYTALKLVMINFSRNGATCFVKIERTMGGETEYTALGTYSVAGWSDWNSYPIITPFGGGEDSTHTTNLRFTFFATKHDSDEANGRFAVMNMLFYGTTNWGVPSNMAATNHLYSWDWQQNATFPKNLSASKFIGPLNYSLSINGKTFNNSSSLTVGTLGLAYGGTGQTNRKDALKVFLGQNSAADLNSALDLGTYTWGSSSTNAPVSGGYGTLVNLLNMGSTKSDSTWLTQLAFGTNKQFYWRSKINADTFTDWKTVVDTSNYATTLPAITTAQIEEICSATVLDASEVTV